MTESEFTIPQPISVSDLRADLRQVLDRAYYFQRRYLILRNGDAVAVLMGLEDFRLLVGAPGAAPEMNRR